MFAYLLIVFFLFHCPYLSQSSDPDIIALLTDIIDTPDYDLRVMPPENTVTEISIGLAPRQIVQIVETNDEIEVLGNLRIGWKDKRLAFNGSSYGIESDRKVTIAAKHIWSPLLGVTNSIGSSDSLLDISTNSLAAFDSSGRVKLTVRHLFRFSCMLDITFYPYDKQNCSLVLNIEVHKQKHLAVSSIEVGMEQYKENTLWALLLCDALIYSSQPDQSEMMAFRFIVERKRTLHSLIDILPPIALTFLATTVFLVPVESGEKLSFAVSIFLTDAVYVTYIAGLTPRTASSVSYFLLYLILTLVMCAVAAFLAAIVIWLNDREEQGSILKQCCCLPRRRASVEPQSPSGDGLTKRKKAARKMDFICFILHGIAALAITIGIFVFLTL